MSHARQGHPRLTDHSEELWENVVHWRKKWQITPVFLPGEPQEQHENAKRWHWKMSPLVLKVPSILMGRSRGQLLIAPERMKWLGQSRNDSVMDVSDGESKVWCSEEQHYIETWNVRSMNQGKLDMVKQEIARVNIDLLGISEQKWTGMSEFNSDDHCIYYCGGKNPLEGTQYPQSQQESLKCST